MQTSVNQDDNGKVVARPATSGLHPGVYALLIGLAGWFALSVWSFAGAVPSALAPLLRYVSVTDYLLFVVSSFIFIVVALLTILSQVGRSNTKTTGDHDRQSFRQWTLSDFDTWQGRLSGMQAALQILLPIAVAAFGMTAFGIVFHIAERGGT
jgi:hypothetical protein